MHPELLESLFADYAREIHWHQEERDSLCPASGSVLVTSTIACARWPLVMNVFEPLITYSSPFLTARVLIPATSDPASGSVIPMHRIALPWIAGTTHSCFCSSDRKSVV